MTIAELLILMFSTFRFTRLIVDDKITEPIRRPFFTEEVIDGELYDVPKNLMGILLSCHWCVGIWSAIIMYACYQTWYLDLIPVILCIAGLGSFAYLVYEGLAKK